MAFLTQIGANVLSGLGVISPGVGVSSATATAVGAATVGVGGFAAIKGTQLLTKALTPKLPEIAPLPSLTTPTQQVAPSIEAARKTTREETLALIRRKRAGTILTSPQGVLEQTTVLGKTLLGA